MTLNQRNNYVIIASLKSETMGKLLNGIPCSCLIILSLPGSSLRMHVEMLDMLLKVNKRSERERASCFAFFVFLVSGDCCVSLPHGATGLSAVCDCGIS